MYVHDANGDMTKYWKQWSEGQSRPTYKSSTHTIYWAPDARHWRITTSKGSETYAHSAFVDGGDYGGTGFCPADADWTSSKFKVACDRLTYGCPQNSAGGSTHVGKTAADMLGSFLNKHLEHSLDKSSFLGADMYAECGLPGYGERRRDRRQVGVRGARATHSPPAGIAQETAPGKGARGRERRRAGEIYTCNDIEKLKKDEDVRNNAVIALYEPGRIETKVHVKEENKLEILGGKGNGVKSCTGMKTLVEVRNIRARAVREARGECADLCMWNSDCTGFSYDEDRCECSLGTDGDTIDDSFYSSKYFKRLTDTGENTRGAGCTYVDRERHVL